MYIPRPIKSATTPRLVTNVSHARTLMYSLRPRKNVVLDFEICPQGSAMVEVLDFEICPQESAMVDIDKFGTHSKKNPWCRPSLPYM